MVRVTGYVFLLVVLAPLLAQAQSLVAGEEGQPYYARRYTADEYRLHNQNWSVAQDARGVIYVANRNGLLEYDGATWRTIPVPNEFVRSLVVGDDGRVYVGGVRELGYLAPDSTGGMAYVSLLDRLPEAERDFSDVWTTLATPDGVYFETSGQIVRWDGHRIRTWKTDDRFFGAFAVRGTYYVREENVGLLRIREDTLEPVPGGDRFADERIDALLPVSEDGLLARTRTQGFLRIEDGQVQSFETEADAYLADKRVYHGAMLYDGTYALTTTSGSVVLMSPDGRVQRVLGSDVGLQPDDLVLYAMPDQQRGLWLALDDGILRVDVPASLTLLGPGSGLQGTAYEMLRHEGTLYVGTTQGLFRLRPGSRLDSSLLFDGPRFERVEGIDGQSYALLAAGQSLLAATNDGIYEILGGRTRLVSEGKALSLALQEGGERAFAGLKEGVAVLERGPAGWGTTGMLDGVTEEIRVIGRGPDDELWLGTLLEGVLRVGLDDDLNTEVERFGEADGLPNGPALVWEFDDGLAVHTMQGVYRFRPEGQRGTFVPDSTLNAVIKPDGDTHYVVSGTEQGGLWIARDRQVEVYQRTASGALVDRTPPVLHLSSVRVRAVYDEGNGVVWIASEEGLFRYDGTLDKTYAEPYRALVRRVTDKHGDTLYGGADTQTLEAPPFRIGHERNSVRFTFSAPTYNNPEATLYQHWLEGFDEGWSAWTTETHKEYTNLPEDAYRFHVRARNAQGVLSQEAIYAFQVLPPWYRTWWAYALYVLAAALVVWAYGQMKMRRHAAELEREREVNRQLETANTRLRQANERLKRADKLKDDFLANTSHELRTPLTSILGFASVLQEELSGELRTFATMIQQGGERLLETVNALLDMARLQADLMELEPADLDVVAEVREIVGALRPQAEAKGLYLTVAPGAPQIPARLDRFCLERILVNLVGNAIKFTEEGGVTIALDAADETVEFTVRDTGIGIQEEFLPELFSEFKQASSGYGRAYEGSGLGLAITQRIIHLLGGSIEVESEVAHGAEFRIRLPRYDARHGTAAASNGDPLALSPSLRVLLVESPSRPQTRLRHLLAASEVTVVRGAEAGYDAVRQGHYDLLLVDSQLGPLESGHTLLEAARLVPGYETTPAVALTSYAIPGDGELYSRLGFVAHLGKPITKERLAQVIDLATAEPTDVQASLEPHA